MVNRNSFITIQGWMVTDLGLSNYELLFYALVYGFCQFGNNWFYGTKGYAAEWMRCSTKTVLRTAKALVEKGLLERRERDESGTTIVEYRIASEELCCGKPDPKDEAQTEDEPVEAKKPEKKQEEKPKVYNCGKYGWPKLTADQQDTLRYDLGEEEFKRCLNYVDELAQMTGNKYKWKDWNLVIRKCHREQWGVKGDQRKQQKPPERDDVPYYMRNIVT